MSFTAKLGLRRLHIPVLVRAPGFGEVTVGEGTPQATLTGEPGELALFVSGRQRAARWTSRGRRRPPSACAPPPSECETGSILDAGRQRRCPAGADGPDLDAIVAVADAAELTFRLVARTAVGLVHAIALRGRHRTDLGQPAGTPDHHRAAGSEERPFRSGRRRARPEGAGRARFHARQRRELPFDVGRRPRGGVRRHQAGADDADPGQAASTASTAAPSQPAATSSVLRVTTVDYARPNAKAGAGTR